METRQFYLPVFSLLLIHLPITLIFISLLYFIQHNSCIFSFKLLGVPSPISHYLFIPHLSSGPLIPFRDPPPHPSSPFPHPSFSLFPYISSLVTFTPHLPAPPPPPPS